MITLVLADDHSIVRTALRTFLEGHPEFRVIGEAGDGLVAEQTVMELDPDILVLDLMMPGINGLEVIRRVGQHSSRTGIVILSMYSDEPHVLASLKAGARAYVLKESSSDELVHAIREVAAGNRYLSRSLSDHIIQAYVSDLGPAADDPFEELTPREREVLQMVAEGNTNVQIAARLVVSPRTVETHRAHLMRKLGLETQTDLIRYAIRKGIIPMDV